MSRLAAMWAEREFKRREMRRLRLMVGDLRKAQAEMRPIQEEAEKRRKAGLRQDGEAGFVMVAKQ